MVFTVSTTNGQVIKPCNIDFCFVLTMDESFTVMKAFLNYNKQIN